MLIRSALLFAAGLGAISVNAFAARGVVEHKLNCAATASNASAGDVAVGTAELILLSSERIPRVPQAAKLTFTTHTWQRDGSDVAGNRAVISQPAGSPFYMVPAESYAKSYTDNGSLMHIALAPLDQLNIDWNAVQSDACKIHPQIQITFANLTFPPVAGRYGARVSGRAYTRPSEGCRMAVTSELYWYSPVTLDCELATAAP